MTSPRVGLMGKPGSSRTGTSRYANSLLNGLREIGISADIIPASGAPVPDAIRRVARFAGLDVDAFFASYPVGVEMRDYDLLHLTTQTQATVLVARRFEIPVVATVLDILPYLLRDHPKLRSFRHPLDEMFYRAALAGLRRADAIIAISEYTRRTLIDALGFSPDRVVVTPLAVDHQIFRPIAVDNSVALRWNLASGRPRLLYVGSDDPRKNLETLVRSLELVRHAHPECELIIVGASQFTAIRERLQALIGELRLSSAVHFLSGVNDDELALLYNLADITVMPSLWEGFGLPALEAMACGRAVIVANATSLPEVAGEAARLIGGHDPAEMASAISTLLSDATERQRLGQAAMERAKTFTWEATARATAAVYDIVLGERSSGGASRTLSYHRS